MAQEMVRMGEAWGQPRANCLDVGVKTRWFVGTACVRLWGRGGACGCGYGRMYSHGPLLESALLLESVQGKLLQFVFYGVAIFNP